MQVEDKKTTLLVTSTANPDGLAFLQNYVSLVMPKLLSIGGEVIKRSQITDIYHGEEHFQFLLVMDFPSKQDLIRFFDSQEYQDLIPDRDKGFLTIDILFAEDIQ